MSKPNFMSMQPSSLSPANGHRQTVGDGASAFATASDAIAVNNNQSMGSNVHYYSTTFSGGPGWRF